MRAARTRRSSSSSARTHGAGVHRGHEKFGYECVKPMCEELLAFMDRHKFETLADSRKEPRLLHHACRPGARQAEEGRGPEAAGKVVKSDGEWTGDEFVKQSDALPANRAGPPMIRLAEKGDAAQIAAIYRPVLRGQPHPFLEAEAPGVAEVASRIEAILRKFPWLVDERDGVVAGYAYASRTARRTAGSPRSPSTSIPISMERASGAPHAELLGRGRRLPRFTVYRHPNPPGADSTRCLPTEALYRAVGSPGPARHGMVAMADLQPVVMPRIHAPNPRRLKMTQRPPFSPAPSSSAPRMASPETCRGPSTTSTAT